MGMYMHRIYSFHWYMNRASWQAATQYRSQSLNLLLNSISSHWAPSFSLLGSFCIRQSHYFEASTMTNKIIEAKSNLNYNQVISEEDFWKNIDFKFYIKLSIYRPMKTYSIHTDTCNTDILILNVIQGDDKLLSYKAYPILWGNQTLSHLALRVLWCRIVIADFS